MVTTRHGASSMWRQKAWSGRDEGVNSESEVSIGISAKLIINIGICEYGSEAGCGGQARAASAISAAAGAKRGSVVASAVGGWAWPRESQTAALSHLAFSAGGISYFMWHHLASQHIMASCMKKAQLPRSINIQVASSAASVKLWW
jgi:tetrahydromethanopterin S-methyltransferase subunit H